MPKKKKKVYLDGKKFPAGTERNSSSQFYAGWNRSLKYRLDSKYFNIDDDNFVENTLNCPGLAVTAETFSTFSEGDVVGYVAPVTTSYQGTIEIEENDPDYSITTTVNVNPYGCTESNNKIIFNIWDNSKLFHKWKEMFKGKVLDSDWELILEDGHDDAKHQYNYTISIAVKVKKMLTSLRNGDIPSFIKALEAGSIEKYLIFESGVLKKPAKEILNIYQKNPEELYLNFEKYIYSWWTFVEEPPEKWKEFCKFFNKATISNRWMPSVTSCRERDDSRTLLFMDKIPPELKKILMKVLDESIDELDKRIRESQKTLDRINELMKTYVPFTYTLLGVDDKIKIANRLAKETEFINYDSLSDISLSALNRKKSFNYFIDRNCRIVIITNNNFYKLTVSPTLLQRSLGFDDIVDEVNRELDRKNRHLRQKEDELLLKRIENNQVAPDDGCLINSDYEKLVDSIRLLDTKLYYLNSVPKENRDLYAKLDWWTKLNLIKGTNTYGFVKQKVTE